MVEKPTLLDLGVCPKGHQIYTEDDCYIRFSPHTGKRQLQCRHCKRENSNKLRRVSDELGREPPREIFYSCGHDDQFKVPFPVPQEIVLCRRCDDYVTVSRVGSRIDEEKKNARRAQRGLTPPNGV